MVASEESRLCKSRPLPVLVFQHSDTSSTDRTDRRSRTTTIRSTPYSKSPFQSNERRTTSVHNGWLCAAFRSLGTHMSMIRGNVRMYLLISQF